MPSVTVGVDAGGSGTTAALAVDGETKRTHTGEAANPSSAGVSAACDRIVACIRAVLDDLQPDAIVVGAAGAGRAGVAQAIARAVQGRFEAARVHVCDDAVIALRASVPEGDGAVLVAGTGSIAYAQAGEQTFRRGGYGYAIGDEGSGFSIGRASLLHLARALDGRAPRDAFADALLERLQARDLDGVLMRAYERPFDVSWIAGFAALAIERANAGDRSASGIVQRAALELADLAKAIVKAADLAQTGAPLVFAGGLLRANSMLTYLLETRLSNDLPQMPIVKDAADPYAGALHLAAQL